MTLTSCQTTNAGKFFNKPINLDECFTLEQVGKMACNGIVIDIPAGLPVPKTPEVYFAARKYYEKRELGHYICVKWPKNCEKNP